MTHFSLSSLLVLIVTGLLGYGCQQQSTGVDLKEKLQGDWVGNTEGATLLIWQDKMIEGDPWLTKQFDPFRIEDRILFLDSIRHRSSQRIKQYHVEGQYSIEYLTADTLKLSK